MYYAKLFYAHVWEALIFIINVDQSIGQSSYYPSTEEEAPSKDSTLYETLGLSPGGQVYTNTEIGKYIYGGCFLCIRSIQAVRLIHCTYNAHVML